MPNYYEVLRPVSEDDLHTEPRIARVLRQFPSQGRLTSTEIKDMGIQPYRVTRYACAKGILRHIPRFEDLKKLETVRFWSGQISDSGYKNMLHLNCTAKTYMRELDRFNQWLPGKEFPSQKTIISDGQIIKKGITKSFSTIEELLQFCMESEHGKGTAQRIVRQFLVEPELSSLSLSVQNNSCAAIKSYFRVHDIMLDVIVTQKRRVESAVSDEMPMTLDDLYKTIRNGNPGIAMRTIMIVKFQSGMDSSTFVDRFNFEGYGQLVRYFKTKDHSMWDVDMCPVPIRLVRVKTGVHYTTFLDRDAITHLKEYLAWKENKHGRQDSKKPLFVTNMDNPINSNWISKNFSNMAIRAGIQTKVSRRVYRIRAHDVRDLLKSTLMAAGCKQYAADHVLGHAPRDSYEKQAVLYPDDLRAEYAKASFRLNIFARIESRLDGSDDYDGMAQKVVDLTAQLQSKGENDSAAGMKGETDADVIASLKARVNTILELLVVILNSGAVDKIPPDALEKAMKAMKG